MKWKKLFRIKNLAILFVLFALAFTVWYFQLSNRHKAIVKTTLLHSFGIIDNDWEIEESTYAWKLESPELLVDNIYQSMDGPQAVLNLNMNPNSEKVQWITGFKAEVLREGTSEHNNDLLCHTNIDYYDAVHYKNLKLPKRINTVYPRLGTLSNGINELNFPDGFGFPVASDDAFIIASRTLNHNIENAFFKVKHHIELKTAPANANLKPLVPKGLVLMLPYDLENPYKSKKNDPNLCSPIDLKNHSGPGEDGVSLSAHWKLPEGETRYEFDITYQLNLNENTTIHAMAAHLHPGAQKFELFDITLNETVYSFECENYADKIGLKNVPNYSSVEGIELFSDHQYKLILDTYNPGTGFRDMMAVLFIYLYDKELEQVLIEHDLTGLSVTN
ncbi:MAG: hypothetical protein KJO23_06975 [Bacteroidia bacterium]|nr:hypothetical protein [Bacteroidia bacterium]NNM23682.1 hypothetical protein [Flavobacteriaceae bacterium]